MKYYVTGGTGYIGEHLVSFLVKSGHQVVMLVRPQSKAKVKLDHKNLSCVYGNITDRASLGSGMKGCDGLFHLAALADVYSRHKSAFYDVNVNGTKNILECALSKGIKNIVITSTGGVMALSGKGMADESTPRKNPYYTQYETTKYQAEQVALGYSKRGLKVVIVNPTRVFGPVINQTTALTELVDKYVNGSWRVIPGDGKFISNFTFVDDVIKGHLAAMEKGRSGERYILGGENLSFNQFFANLAEVSGVHKNMIKVPFSLSFLFAYLQLYRARIFYKKPLITPNWIRKYYNDYALSSDKAQRELNYKITPIKEAMALSF